MRERKNWIVGDPAPGIPLDQIERLSTRAYALQVRSTNSPACAAGFIDISGATEMIAGMEYHHENFKRIYHAVVDPWSDFPSMLRHEAVAYLNRMAQFHTFARSCFVKRYVSNALSIIPTIVRLRIFRDKFTAHRSLDWPKKADTEKVAVGHAMSLSETGGLILIPRADNWPRPSVEHLSLPEAYLAERMYRHRSSYVAYQIYDASSNANVEFVLERDHAGIVGEAYSLIETLIEAPS